MNVVVGGGGNFDSQVVLQGYMLWVNRARERGEERGEGEGKKNTRGRIQEWVGLCWQTAGRLDVCMYLRHSRYDLSIGDVYETSNYFATVEGEVKEKRNTRE